MGIRDQPRRESGTGRDENLAPAVIAHSDLHRAFRTPTVREGQSETIPGWVPHPCRGGGGVSIRKFQDKME